MGLEVISIVKKIILNFTVKDQRLKRIDETVVVNKLRNMLVARFHFDGWDGLNVFAIFKNKNKSYCFEVPIEENVGECVVPWEVLQERWFKLTLFGGDLLTTNELTVYLLESGYPRRISPTAEPSPDIFVQVFDDLDGKADVVHTHSISDVDNLNDELGSIQEELNQKSNVDHTHISSDVTDLEDSMNVDVKRALNSLAGSIRTYGE